MNNLFHSSGGRKSKMEVQAWWVLVRAPSRLQTVSFSVSSHGQKAGGEGLGRSSFHKGTNPIHGGPLTSSSPP